MKFPLESCNISKYQDYVILINNGIKAEEIMIKYIDTLVTAMNPRDVSRDTETDNQGTLDPHPCCIDISLIAQGDYPTDFKELVNCVQRHVCRLDGYCKKKNKVDKKPIGDPVCRFGYPFSLNEKTIIKFTESKSNVRADLVLKSNDPHMNAHMPIFAHAWRANTDAQPIIESRAAIEYMVKYASKCKLCVIFDIT